MILLAFTVNLSSILFNELREVTLPTKIDKLLNFIKSLKFSEFLDALKVWKENLRVTSFAGRKIYGEQAA